MTVLITGASGLLGGRVLTAALDRRRPAVVTYHRRDVTAPVPTHQLDVTDTDAFEELLAAHDVDTVVNCAAMTDVDACEADAARAMAVNGEAPGAMAAAAADHGAGFVQVSTDYVFDGRSPDRYAVDDATNPIQAYGRSKRRGEVAVTDAHPSPSVVRLSFLYGRARGGDLRGFPAWLLDRLDDGEPTPLFTDQHVTPTRAGAAAETILELDDADASGTFHVAARDCVTPHRFGTRLAEAAGASTAPVKHGLLADVDRPAARPRHTCLAVDQVERVLGRPEPTLAADLAAIGYSSR